MPSLQFCAEDMPLFFNAEFKADMLSARGFVGGHTGNNNCCPTDDGTQLACCEQQSSASCAANAGCIAVGLTGNNNCCPTDDGTQLACCDQMSANPEGLQVV